MAGAECQVFQKHKRRADVAAPEDQDLVVQKDWRDEQGVRPGRSQNFITYALGAFKGF